MKKFQSFARARRLTQAARSALLCLLPLFALCALHGTASAQQGPQHGLQHATISASFYQLDVELALTPEQQEIGLMFRRALPQTEGMLFVFPAPSQQCFWMKNTLVALTAAFVADDGSIVNLEDMKPQTTTSHCSIKPVRFVLEVPQGWFAKRGMKANTRLQGAMFTN